MRTLKSITEGLGALMLAQNFGALIGWRPAGLTRPENG